MKKYGFRIVIGKGGMGPKTLAGLSASRMSTAWTCSKSSAYPKPCGIRAIYGGVALGFGAYLLLCARRQKWEEGLTASLLTFAGLVLARVVGITLDGNPGPIVGGAAASEVVGLVLNIAALKSVRNRSTASA